MKKIILILLLSPFVLTTISQAQQRSRRVVEDPQWSWDLGVAFGSYDNYSYDEIDLGLNDRFSSIFNWRNVLWDRFSSFAANSAVGVDSSLRYEYNDRSDGHSAGFRFFVGPGFRVATSNYSGVFAEGGAIFRFGGLNLGAGVKALNYFSPGTDPVTGLKLSSTDLMYFIILSGGGAF